MVFFNVVKKEFICLLIKQNKAIIAWFNYIFIVT